MTGQAGSDRHRATSGHQPYVAIIAVDGANVNDGSIGQRTLLQGTVATNNWEAHALAATVGWKTRNKAHQFRRSAPTAWVTVLSQTQVEILFHLDHLGIWQSFRIVFFTQS